MRINKNISISESGFVFNPATGETFTLNPIAVDIINAMRTEGDIAKVKKIILDKYATDEASFDKDYYDFMQMLKSYNLLEESAVQTDTNKEKTE